MTYDSAASCIYCARLHKSSLGCGTSLPCKLPFSGTLVTYVPFKNGHFCHVKCCEKGCSDMNAAEIIGDIKCTNK